MNIYCKNIDTGKFHQVSLKTWTEAECCPTPLEEQPKDTVYGGLIKIQDGACFPLPPNVNDLTK